MSEQLAPRGFVIPFKLLINEVTRCGVECLLNKDLRQRMEGHITSIVNIVTRILIQTYSGFVKPYTTVHVTGSTITRLIAQLSGTYLPRICKNEESVLTTILQITPAWCEHVLATLYFNSEDAVTYIMTDTIYTQQDVDDMKVGYTDNGVMNVPTNSYELTYDTLVMRMDSTIDDEIYSFNSLRVNDAGVEYYAKRFSYYCGIPKVMCNCVFGSFGTLDQVNEALNTAFCLTEYAKDVTSEQLDPKNGIGMTTYEAHDAIVIRVVCYCNYGNIPMYTLGIQLHIIPSIADKLRMQLDGLAQSFLVTNKYTTILEDVTYNTIPPVEKLTFNQTWWMSIIPTVLILEQLCRHYVPFTHDTPALVRRIMAYDAIRNKSEELLIKNMSEEDEESDEYSTSSYEGETEEIEHYLYNKSECESVHNVGDHLLVQNNIELCPANIEINDVNNGELLLIENSSIVSSGPRLSIRDVVTQLLTVYDTNNFDVNTTTVLKMIETISILQANCARVKKKLGELQPVEKSNTSIIIDNIFIQIATISEILKAISNQEIALKSTQDSLRCIKCPDVN